MKLLKFATLSFFVIFGTAIAQEKERQVLSLSSSAKTQVEACSRVKNMITSGVVNSGVKVVKMNACECGQKSEGDVLCTVDYVVEKNNR